MLLLVSVSLLLWLLVMLLHFSLFLFLVHLLFRDLLKIGLLHETGRLRLDSRPLSGSSLDGGAMDSLRHRLSRGHGVSLTNSRDALTFASLHLITEGLLAHDAIFFLVLALLLDLF